MVLLLAIPAWILWGTLTALVAFAGGIIAGDKDWPWEHQHEGDEDDNSFIDSILDPIKKGFAGLLLIGALIVGATLYRGGK